MKKALITIALALSATFGMTAEELFEPDDQSPKFGFRIAWDLSHPSTDLYKPINPVNNGSGVSAGAFCTLPLSRNFYFEPGVTFFYNTMIINYSMAEDMIVGYELPAAGSLRNAGFRIPLNFGYRIGITDDIAISVFTGPQLNIGVSYKQHSKSSEHSIDLYKNGYNRVDLQWVIGARFHYADNWIAEISGGLGLTNQLSSKEYPGLHFRRHTFSIGVGYLF